MATFAINDVYMKIAMTSLGFAQAVAIRGMLCSLLLGILAWRLGVFRQKRKRSDEIYILLRSLADLGTTITFLGALMHMPIGNISAVMQFAPLAVTFAAAIFFGETIGWRRILAILIGFIGVVIILRPGPEGFDIWAILGLLSVCCVVVRDLLTRKLNHGVSTIYVAFIGAVCVMAMGLIGLPFSGWTPVSGGAAMALVLAAGMIIIGYVTIVGTMRIGNVGAVAPFRYMSLLWSVLLGWFILSEVPDMVVVLGSLLVVGSGIFSLFCGGREKAAA